MKVKDYLLENPNKASYTIRINKKYYGCNVVEALKVFGNLEVKTVTNRLDSEELVQLNIDVPKSIQTKKDVMKFIAQANAQ